MAKIALAFTHTRRAATQLAYKRAFKLLGHAVISIGPFDESQPFGVRECMPDVLLPSRTPPHYDWSEGLIPPSFGTPDLFVLMAGGEDLRVTGVPVPFSHWCSEGSHMEWSDTPHKYAEIMCNGADPATVKWMPKAFEYHAPREAWPKVREYDIVQLASAREARVQSWRDVLAAAPDLHCVFGDIWGPLYPTAYQHALATWVCSGHDFVTTRVFEAMAMGCVVLADPQSSMRQLFTRGDHYIEYEPVPGPGGEGMPDTAWLIDTVRQLRKRGDGGMAKRAYAKVVSEHSYQHRAARIIREVCGR